MGRGILEGKRREGEGDWGKGILAGKRSAHWAVSHAPPSSHQRVSTCRCDLHDQGSLGRPLLHGLCSQGAQNTIFSPNPFSLGASPHYYSLQASCFPVCSPNLPTLCQQFLYYSIFMGTTWTDSVSCRDLNGHSPQGKMVSKRLAQIEYA